MPKKEPKTKYTKRARENAQKCLKKMHFEELLGPCT
jgi:hypothetical protein